MKNLIFKLIIPLTIISFVFFTKWWYAIPTDAPDTMFYGFPFIYTCQGWHTSMSLQIFVLEFIADFLIYFLVWFILISLINSFLIKLKPNKFLTIFLWIICGFIIVFESLILSNKDNVFRFKRPFEIKVLETGNKFILGKEKRPDYYKYFPKEKK